LLAASLSIERICWPQRPRYGPGAATQGHHIREQALGLEHPAIATSLNLLANLSRDQGQYQQAEAFYLRALSLRRQFLKQEHPDIAETLHDLAQFRERQQQLTEALSLYQQALSIWQQALRSHHPKITQTRQRLCALLQALGRTEEAAALEASSDQARQEDGETNTSSDVIGTAG
ncbi:MAG TPA: tetratricopeptide repeat protein, partial [Ktedonobacteraceae bacterium]|nr:tetratricopeptide repeat protein [Ktedonobacteraceae bacterium]